MNNKSIKSALVGIYISVIAISNVANAGLIDRGNGMIYDDVLDITWLQNANLSDLAMNWDDSVSWAASLTHGGFDDWRLPSLHVSELGGNCDLGNDGTDCGYNVLTANSELAYMFYENLGNIAYFDTNGNGPQTGWDSLNTEFTDMVTGNTVSFINLERTFYWSGTEFEPDTDGAWYFYTNDGRQGSFFKSSVYYAWAVRDGDVTEVPEPSTLVILALGMLGLVLRNK